MSKKRKKAKRTVVVKFPDRVSVPAINYGKRCVVIVLPGVKISRRLRRR